MRMLLFNLLVLVLFTTLSAAETVASNDSSCVFSEVQAGLGIAAQIIETSRQKIPTDLKEVCSKYLKIPECKNITNVECPECKNITDVKCPECKNITDIECPECKNITDVKCPVCERPKDCSDIYLNGERKDGIYEIWLQSRVSSGSLRVYCDMESNGGGWTVLQRRGDYNNTQDFFYRDWNAYKTGFGDMLKEFWIGNDNLFGVTYQRHYQLRVDLTAWNGDSAYATYEEFWISDELQNYTLQVSGYRGTAGDSLLFHNGQQFGTKDRQNSNWGGTNCAVGYKGAWWYKSCMASNLNGLYLRGNDSTTSTGISWRTFKGERESLKGTVMKIRPTSFAE